MTKAFRGYINYIKDDDDAQKALDFAEHVALENLLLTAWEGVRRDLLPSPDDMVTEPADMPLSNDPTLLPTVTFPAYDPTSDPTHTLPGLVAHPVSSQRLQGFGVAGATNSTATATKCGQDGEMAPGTQVTVAVTLLTPFQSWWPIQSPLSVYKASACLVLQTPL